MLMNPNARFELAQRFREGGASLGEVFAFLSGLYFRGKLTYALRFTATAAKDNSPLIITAGKGLMPCDTLITPQTMQEFSGVDISVQNDLYLRPLNRDLAKLKKKLAKKAQVVLLGSVATDKYVAPLLQHFGSQLYFPEEFKGRGDMSRGAMLLRAVIAQKELEYQALRTGVQKGFPRARSVNS